MDTNTLRRESYTAMIDTLISNSYRICKYQDFDNGKYCTFPLAILRHDVDFSLPIALELASIEHRAGIQATYFIHLRSSIYNALGEKNAGIIEQIISLGHDVALHINYEANLEQLAMKVSEQVQTLKYYFPRANSKIVSFHKPGIDAKKLIDFSLSDNIAHTYQRKYFVDTAYFSDSGGGWRNGNPINTDEFKQRKSMQILTHPLWWLEDGNTPLEKIENFVSRNKSITIDLIEKTIVSYSLDSLR